MRPIDARIIFNEELNLFSSIFNVSATAFVIESRHFLDMASDRDYAWAEILTQASGAKQMSVHLIKRSLNLPEVNVRAIIRHELGHCSDDFVSMSGAEQRADDIAQLVSGSRISYDNRLVQTLGNGKYPRPSCLRS